MHSFVNHTSYLVSRTSRSFSDNLLSSCMSVLCLLDLLCVTAGLLAILLYTVSIITLPKAHMRLTSSPSSFSSACSIFDRMAGKTFWVSWSACLCRSVRDRGFWRVSDTHLLPQCVFLVFVTLAGLELLDALCLLHELLVIASFLLDQPCDGAGRNGKLRGWCHIADWGCRTRFENLFIF